MMPTQRRGLARLVSRDGHAEWVEPILRVIPGVGYTLGMPCDGYGGAPMDHYVARDARGVACWQTAPFVFPGIADAEAARDELAAQQQGEGE